MWLPSLTACLLRQKIHGKNRCWAGLCNWLKKRSLANQSFRGGWISLVISTVKWLWFYQLVLPYLGHCFSSGHYFVRQVILRVFPFMVFEKSYGSTVYPLFFCVLHFCFFRILVVFSWFLHYLTTTGSLVSFSIVNLLISFYFLLLFGFFQISVHSSVNPRI